MRYRPKVPQCDIASRNDSQLNQQYSTKENTTTAPYSSYNGYGRKRNGGRRKAAYSNTRSENNYYEPFKSSKKDKNKQRNKIRSGKYAKLDLQNIDDSKSACNVILNSGKYFETVLDEAKRNLVDNFKVDDFTAELALYITDGNEEASKAFLTSK